MRPDRKRCREVSRHPRNDQLQPRTQAAAAFVVERHYAPEVREEVDDVLDDLGVACGFVDAQTAYERRAITDYLKRGRDE